MKISVYFMMCILIKFTVFPASVEAQVFKGFGKKLEKKIENRIERKADRQVDKALDKADKKSDESINDAFSKPKSGTQIKQDNKSVVAVEKIDIRPDQAVILLGDNCQDFSWFKTGTQLVYESRDTKGRVDAEIKMQVQKLANDGTATIAEIQATMSSPTFGELIYPMNYICDGDRLYMDIASMMKAMMENNPEMKTESVQSVLKDSEIDMSNGFASFPKTMYPGMKLEDLSISFKTKVANGEMSFHTTVTERQVISKEKVTTKAGTFDCLKIRSVTNTSLNVMGMNQKMPSSTEFLWIAPGIGMVKQETQSDKDISAMELKAYKM